VLGWTAIDGLELDPLHDYGYRGYQVVNYYYLLLKIASQITNKN